MISRSGYAIRVEPGQAALEQVRLVPRGNDHRDAGASVHRPPDAKRSVFDARDLGRFRSPKGEIPAEGLFLAAPVGFRQRRPGDEGECHVSHPARDARAQREVVAPIEPGLRSDAGGEHRLASQAERVRDVVHREEEVGRPARLEKRGTERAVLRPARPRRRRSPPARAPRRAPPPAPRARRPAVGVRPAERRGATPSSCGQRPARAPPRMRREDETGDAGAQRPQRVQDLPARLVRGAERDLDFRRGATLVDRRAHGALPAKRPRPRASRTRPPRRWDRWGRDRLPGSAALPPFQPIEVGRQDRRFGGGLVGADARDPLPGPKQALQKDTRAVGLEHLEPV